MVTPNTNPTTPVASAGTNPPAATPPPSTGTPKPDSWTNYTNMTILPLSNPGQEGKIFASNPSQVIADMKAHGAPDSVIAQYTASVNPGYLSAVATPQAAQIANAAISNTNAVYQKGGMDAFNLAVQQGKIPEGSVYVPTKQGDDPTKFGFLTPTQYKQYVTDLVNKGAIVNITKDIDPSNPNVYTLLQNLDKSFAAEYAKAAQAAAKFTSGNQIDVTAALQSGRVTPDQLKTLGVSGDIITRAQTSLTTGASVTVPNTATVSTAPDSVAIANARATAVNTIKGLGLGASDTDFLITLYDQGNITGLNATLANIMQGKEFRALEPYVKYRTDQTQNANILGYTGGYDITKMIQDGVSKEELARLFPADKLQSALTTASALSSISAASTGQKDANGNILYDTTKLASIPTSTLQAAGFTDKEIADIKNAPIVSTTHPATTGKGITYVTTPGLIGPPDLSQAGQQRAQAIGIIQRQQAGNLGLPKSTFSPVTTKPVASTMTPAGFGDLSGAFRIMGGAPLPGTKVVPDYNKYVENYVTSKGVELPKIGQGFPPGYFDAKAAAQKQYIKEYGWENYLLGEFGGVLLPAATAQIQGRQATTGQQVGQAFNIGMAAFGLAGKELPPVKVPEPEPYNIPYKAIPPEVQPMGPGGVPMPRPGQPSFPQMPPITPTVSTLSGYNVKMEGEWYPGRLGLSPETTPIVPTGGSPNRPRGYDPYYRPDIKDIMGATSTQAVTSRVITAEPIIVKNLPIQPSMTLTPVYTEQIPPYAVTPSFRTLTSEMITPTAKQIGVEGLQVISKPSALAMILGVPALVSSTAAVATPAFSVVTTTPPITAPVVTVIPSIRPSAKTFVTPIVSPAVQPAARSFYTPITSVATGVITVPVTSTVTGIRPQISTVTTTAPLTTVLPVIRTETGIRTTTAPTISVTPDALTAQLTSTQVSVTPATFNAIMTGTIQPPSGQPPTTSRDETGTAPPPFFFPQLRSTAGSSQPGGTPVERQKKLRKLFQYIPETTVTLPKGLSKGTISDILGISETKILTPRREKVVAPKARLKAGATEAGIPSQTYRGRTIVNRNFTPGL